MKILSDFQGRTNAPLNFAKEGDQRGVGNATATRVTPLIVRVLHSAPRPLRGIYRKPFIQNFLPRAIEIPK